ncbi:hypothetical protein PV10_03591 [Exophiala mesophila]|uniref:Signal recognition particle subunit SRP72 n=1 Tax=Exophiala mesophila TaxID=212818 RepID=A0A0D1ZN44_EXOME|nr:uncharacterized protein PV10_03591 [Exophiala mesophila]KIV96007.1 hypothetical protein PV10_03591 [Exophiala mesophila]
MATSSLSSLSSILKKSSLDDHDQILDASNRSLKSSPSDLQAHQVKTVALLKLDRYEEVVKHVESAGEDVRKAVSLEYAYALYKIGRLSEAADIASSIKTRGAQHIEAQARYRLEEATSTSKLYKILRSEPADWEEYDLRVNQGAIDAQAQWLGAVDPKSIRKPAREDLEAFETAYNAACGSIARGELGQAEVLLRRAKELCRHSEDLTDQQKLDELLPIAVQQIYVLLSQGKEAEADQVASEINLQDASDASTQKIGQNNMLLTKPLDNPFLAYKAFTSTKEIPSHDKLFSFQSIPLASNKTTLDLQNFKFDGIVSFTAQASTKKPSSTLDPGTILTSSFQAMARARNETGRAAIKKILPDLQKRPRDAGLVLTLVQLYILVGDTSSAVELVQTFLQDLGVSEQDIRFNPTLVSLYIALLKQRGQKSRVKQELAKAASYWRTKANPPIRLLSAAGISLLESQNPEETREAMVIFEKLQEEQPADRATIAGYVASHVNGDLSAVQGDADKLTPTEELIRGIDVDALEKAGIPQSSNALAIAQLGRTRKRKAIDGGNGKRKRQRASKLPKDYDASKKPDPERWMPMKDRSYYRPPKGKRKGKRGGGDDKTQGGVVNEDLNIDARATATSVTGGASGGSSKKKKAKGKK